MGVGGVGVVLEGAAVGGFGGVEEGFGGVGDVGAFAVGVVGEWAGDGGGVAGLLHFEGGVVVAVVVVVVFALGGGAHDVCSGIEGDELLSLGEAVGEELEPGGEDRWSGEKEEDLHAGQREEDEHCDDSGFVHAIVGRLVEAFVLVGWVLREAHYPRHDLFDIIGDPRLQAVQIDEHNREEDDIHENDGANDDSTPLQPKDLL